MRHLLGIDGRDGSGKSRLAESLCDAAGDRALLLRVDDYRREVNWTRARDEGATYYDDYYDFAALDHVLTAYLAGAAAADTPIFDSVTERVSGTRELAFAGVSLVLVEGVMLGRLQAIDSATRVYLRTGEVEARRRIVDRDMAKGRTRLEVERRVDGRYFPAQRRYHQLHDPEAAAHLLLDHERAGELRVLRSDLDDTPGWIADLLRAAVPDLAS